MAVRKQLSKKVRFDVFKRDSFTCQYCGAHPPGSILHVDHIYPVSEGGTNDADNLVTSCDACNLGKGAALLSDAPKALHDRAKEVKEREDQIAGYNKILTARAARIESESWNIAAALESEEWIGSYRRDRLTSIRTFLEKLPFIVVLNAANIAASMKATGSESLFRYFCGICWAKIREGGHG